MRLLYNLISGEEPVFTPPGGDHEARLACGADGRQRRPAPCLHPLPLLPV